MDSTNDEEETVGRKIPESSKRQNFNLLHIHNYLLHGSYTVLGFPGGSDGKESPHHVGNLGLIPGLQRSPRGGHGNPLQYSCLENHHGQTRLTGNSPRGCKESDTTEQLSTAHIYYIRASQVTLVVKNPLANVGGEGNGNPLQYSCLGNPRGGGAWWTAIYRVARSQTRLKRLSSSSNMVLWVALGVKNHLTNAGDLRDVCLIPGSGRSPGRGHGNPHQYSCLKNPMDRGGWWVAKSRTLVLK